MSTQILPAPNASASAHSAVAPHSPHRPTEKRRERWGTHKVKPRDLVALGFILLLGAFLRFYHLGAASLWSDEIFSRYYADVFGLHFLFTQGLSKEPTPPTYYLLLRGWVALWGDSEAALRSLSAVASILCVPVTYWLGRESGNRRQALSGALLFAICPMSIYFAQEARVYAVFMLAASLVVWAAARFTREPQSAKAIAFYSVFATLCLYLHATGVLFVLAAGGAVWLSFLLRGPSGRRALGAWTALNAGVLLLGVPYFLHTLSASHSGGLDWMPRAGMHQLVYCTAQLLSGVLTPYPWPGLPLAGAAVAALAVSLLLYRPSRQMGFILMGAPCFYIVLVLLVSIGRPILLPRILAWMIVPLCVLAGRQLFMAGRARAVLLLSMVALFGFGLFFQIATVGSNKEPWRDITRDFGPQLQKADVVVLSPVSDPLVLTYYAPRLNHVRLWDAGLRPSIMNEAAGRLHIEPITEDEIERAIETHHSVWIVAHSFDLERVNALRSRLPSTLFRVWSCGKAPCVALAGWQPHP